jgi:hypothetical protein
LCSMIIQHKKFRKFRVQPLGCGLAMQQAKA